MKKIFSLMLAMLLTFSMVGCGNGKGNASETVGVNQVALNGTVLSFPCKVQDALDTVKGLAVNDEEINMMVEPGDVETCSLFKNSNLSFVVKNKSDSAASVKECYIVSVATALSFKELTFDFDVVFPGGVRYGEIFDREKVCEALNIDMETADDTSDRIFSAEFVIDGNIYMLGVLLNEDGSVMNAETKLAPSSAFFSKEEVESVPETESESEEEPEIVENTMEEMYNLFGYAYKLQDIVYDESGLNKSDEILGFSLEDAKVNIKSKGIVISIPGNVQDFLNINSAIEWEVDSEIVNAGESVAFMLPIPYSSAVSMMVKNPTDRELSATECVITSISAKAGAQRVNELDYFDLEFPGGIRIGAPLDSEKVIAEFGECFTAETPDRIEYDWIADNCSLNVNVDKATNLVDWVYVSYFGDDVEYVEPTITQKTPYTSIAENMNVVAVDAQKVADGTNEEVVCYIGNQELRMPCTTQELLDKTGLLLPSEYMSYTVEGSMYMADIPLFNEDGVKCLVIKVLSRNYDPVSDCEVIEVAQAINEFIPQELILTETPQENGQQTYYVKMLEAGDNKIKAISVYRDHTGAELTDAKDAIDSVPAVILETTDLAQAQALIDALTEIGATMDADMLSSEIVEVSEEADNGVAEYEGFLQEVKLFNHAFKTRYVTMYMPVEYLSVATDKNIYLQSLSEQDSYVLIGGQPSMGAPRCENSENILEFYVEQVYTEFNKIWSAADDFEMEIASKEAMTVNEHSMWKYNGTVKGSTTNGIVKEYPFVAYATTAEDTSIFWLLADDSENKDQMETLEKQAQTMAQSYTIK